MSEALTPTNFIRTIIEEDVAAGKNEGQVITRFPPEPNGYLHIGHAKSICLNFGLARDFGGRCHLRFDDTNPVKEDVEYVESIQNDVRWLGFDWGEHLHYASDYFERLFEYAVMLIRKGSAYVCSLSADEIRQYRGTLTEPGKESPYRKRSIEENLDLFQRMRAGEFEEGAHVLRAKIDMASPNIVLRDPTLYRIRKAVHHRTGTTWCIYPMYDFAHCLSDAIEGITHSICTLEFENNRALYDWVIDQVNPPRRPRQYEFARLNLTYTVLSKRKLIRLVQEKHVEGWDDPRMPTLSGLRRRGVPPEAIRNFCDRIGLARRDSVVDVALLEHCIREYLNETALRVMAVLKPLKLIIENFPEDRVEMLDAPYYPDRPELGSRPLPFTRELFIETDDFLEAPPKKFFRLAPDREVRLRYAYFVRCIGVEKNPQTGAIETIRCTYDPETRGGGAPDGRKVKATLHWVSASHGRPAQVRLYNHLFTRPDPDDVLEGGDFTESLNPQSRQVLDNAWIEPALIQARAGERFQFERLGYFCVDEKDSLPNRPVYNRIVTLRDEWEKIRKQSPAT
ncbi:glutamine--tRNA ligase/YqeY domain fusion protein [Desulfatirhabdium butyrativorans]|uniref:glutamine--tRNA ligase/YqeY domain fusion protein n=1 Tax=Desulfatirhabdium butyrativorans TaxID=340467 RepID=UPI000409B72A|nr:glutamine--tRNA ligase/YqeY domain fusion protein [Desulfatirhabdium butyrativorans]